MAAGKHVPSGVPGCGPQDASGRVAMHFAKPAPSGADATADMRDGDADSGSVAPQQPQTTVAATGATMAWRGGGTP
jgi:hypothetical protein